MAALKLEGVYVPVVTPFDADGGLDLSTLGKVIDFCLDGGVRGVLRDVVRGAQERHGPHQ